MTGFYDFSCKDIAGKDVPLATYRDKVVLVVNVASKCGYTPQYKGLEALYQKYKDRGLVVLGFPCNQFGGQEPGTSEEIKGFCELNYSVTFPMFAKVEVNGPETHPLYAFLKKQATGILGTEAIKWNFTKFLLDSQGNVIDRFAPATSPEDLEAEVAKLLK